MRNKLFIRLLGLAVIFAILTGCSAMGSFYHNNLHSGSIQTIEADTITFCLGNADAVTIGQELSVYKYAWPAPYRKSSSVLSKRIETGKIKVTDISNQYEAKASIISGDIRDFHHVDLR